MNIPIFGFTLFLGFTFASFWLFQNTKNEFANDDQAISLITYLAIGWLLGARLFFFMLHIKTFPTPWAFFFPWRYPGCSFVGGIVGIIIAAITTTKKIKIDPWRLSDPALLPLFLYTTAFFLGQFLSSQEKLSLYHVILTLVVAAFSQWLLKHYRSFTWYPSGKIGFTFLLAMSLFLSLSALLAFLLSPDLYFNSIIKLLLSLGAIILWYQRSGREIRQDIKILNKTVPIKRDLSKGKKTYAKK